MGDSTALYLCAKWEGFYAEPYICPAGVVTIGYGTTRYPDGAPVRLSDASITEAAARTLLLAEVTHLRDKILVLTPTLVAHPDKLGAVVSWVYNLGLTRYRASTFYKRLREGRWGEASKECRRWVYGGGKVLKGLVLRRAEEAAIISG